MLACVQQALERVGHKPLFAVAAVVGHDLAKVGNSAEFIFQYHQILVAEADDGVYLRALRVQLFSDGVGDGRTHAAADDGNFFKPFGMTGDAQRSDKIVQGITFFQMIEFLGRCAHDLENDGHGAFLAIVIRDG